MSVRQNLTFHESETWDVAFPCVAADKSPLTVATAFLRVGRDPDGPGPDRIRPVLDIVMPSDIAVTGPSNTVVQVLTTPTIRMGRYLYQLWVTDALGHASLQYDGALLILQKLPDPAVPLVDDDDWRDNGVYRDDGWYDLGLGRQFDDGYDA